MQRHGFQNRHARGGFLQSWLLGEKRRSGLSFAELAALTFVSKSSLQRATQGFGLPSRQVFEAFVRGCASDPEIAESEWQRAKLTNELILGQRMSYSYPEDVTNHAELRQALKDLVKHKGLTLRQIEKLSEKRNAKLRRSTLSDSLSGRQNFSRASVEELARSCGAEESTVQAWVEAWRRAEGDRRGRKGHLGEVRKLPAEARQYVELGIEEIFRVCERYGVSSAETDMYMRQRAKLRRATGRRTYWLDAPKSWKSSVSQPCGDVSGVIEKAIEDVVIENFGGPVNWSLVRGLTKAVLEALRQSESTGDLETPD
ncbi:helix-turn-helix domain-containing protein [Streptomyces coacervatus]|uniref:helix-turn-helix domain-containing protein n=1 Tax=Streptomyces coacervatus TaxID=647381 RepID=UPI0031EFC285